MGKYVAVKLLLIIPSLLVLSLVVFFLSKLAPGDPVASMVELRGKVSEAFSTGEISPEYLDVASDLRLDVPLFYFSIKPAYYPDTLYRIVHPSRKKILKSWLNQNQNWPVVQDFTDQLFRVRKTLANLPESLLPDSDKNQWSRSLMIIENTPATEQAGFEVRELEKALRHTEYFGSPGLEKAVDSLVVSAHHLDQPAKNRFGMLPNFVWYGPDNQYHRWLADLIRLDFGESVIDARPALKKIGYAMGWTLFYVLIAYVISLITAIPLGLFNAWHHGKPLEKLISSASFIFYAFPLFWIATLAAVFLTNDLYAPWLHLFPGIGVGNISSQMSFGQRIAISFPYLILPALVLAMHSAASGIRIVRNSAFSEIKNDYFITAKAKGLTNFQLVWRHVFPNAMLPIITLLVSSFPGALAGSVVLEVIFNIPGMGRLLYDSILFMDWNVVFGILIIMGLLTFLFYLLGDLLYAYLNPKIRYGV
jgi:peptide/nickel transport system permease protein